LVYDWLKQAEATRRLVRENYSEYEGEELLEITIAENVLTQIENLETYPVIRSRLYQGKMQIFGWVYYLETGEVLAYDPETHTYLAPQTQLASIEQEPTPGHYISTSAPVACDLILTTHHQEEPKTSNGQHKSTAQVPPHRSYTGSAPSQTQTNGRQPNNSVNEPALGAGWLSPEQAERIYRGRS
jgi:carbonic anhydrase